MVPPEQKCRVPGSLGKVRAHTPVVYRTVSQSSRSASSRMDHACKSVQHRARKPLGRKTYRWTSTSRSARHSSGSSRQMSTVRVLCPEALSKRGHAYSRPFSTRSLRSQLDRRKAGAHRQCTRQYSPCDPNRVSSISDVFSLAHGCQPSHQCQSVLSRPRQLRFRLPLLRSPAHKLQAADAVDHEGSSKGQSTSSTKCFHHLSSGLGTQRS